MQRVSPGGGGGSKIARAGGLGNCWVLPAPIAQGTGVHVPLEAANSRHVPLKPENYRWLLQRITICFA